MKPSKTNLKSLYVVQAGMIAALYVCLNFVSNAFALSFGPIQLRLSEILCILPVLTPAAVPGLAIGCAIANIASPYGLVDILLGSLTTLLAAALSRKLRQKKWKNLPVLSALMPVLLNGIIIGAEISFFLTASGEARFITFAITMAEVTLGEAVALALGLLLYTQLRKYKLGDEINED